MSKPILNAGTAAIALALFSVNATAGHSSLSTEAAQRAAAGDARAAGKALAKRKHAAAVGYAEQAVQLRPQDASYRALLGKAYLAAGRFFSARQAFADALQLDPGLPGVALNLALATTATGDFAAAQQILDANAGTISASDRGLAIALAGNPVGAVEILLPAARGVNSDAKTRQNLALAFALAGRWREAHQVALADLSPADADARLMQWASFARPTAASDQVSALLGITPVADSGQPVQLTLVTAAAQVASAAPMAPAPAVAPAAAVVLAAPIATAAAAPLTTATEPAVAAVRAPVGQIVFAERREVAQALPAAAPARTVVARYPTPARAAGNRPRSVSSVPAKGNFYVQIGAYANVAIAKWGWAQVSARHRVLAGRTPHTMSSGNGLVRLAAGGFERDDAQAMCRTIKAKGGDCFVRAGAGDRVAGWVRGKVQVAAATAPRRRPSKPV